MSMEPEETSKQRRVGDGQVHLPRLADVVADRIRELVLEGELKDGERLPPLDALLDQFRVSGPSMREALRVLEAEGLIEVQRGSIGGAVVHRPNARMAAYTIALVLRSGGTSKGDVAEALAMLERLCGMACARRSDRESTVVRELRAINAKARNLADGDELTFNDAMLEFHTTLVQRCDNDTLRLLTRALASIWHADMRTWVTSTVWHGKYPKVHGRLAAVEVHEGITELVAAGDEAGVAAAMTTHAEIQRIYREGVDPDERVDPRAVRFGR
ncbi:GntR family transcriptional regulator [Pseudofrankia sp. BMG5.36]|uniref:FadR/GntR family transcriptional regulator n=1 Tax=Pseudofrankia sp. BMG5.36 TaxID=1834512 RepID=UPI0008DAAE6D|nr:GntR family transcriptional regulator [Pseudofrankia sp. BMG5.36]